MNGNFEAIRDLTPEARATYHARHRAAIERIVEQIPLICFTSWDPPDPEGDKEEEGAALTSAFNIQPESSILPGSAFVAKADVSHSATVIRGKKPFDRKAFTESLLAMLADRIASE